MTKAKNVTVDAASFGKILQRLRMAEGWTMTELARRSGFNKNHLRLLELGQNMVSMQMLFALADVFRVEAADIVREVEQQRRGRKAARAAAMLARAGLDATAGDHSPAA